MFQIGTPITNQSKNQKLTKVQLMLEPEFLFLDKNDSFLSLWPGSVRTKN